MFILYSILLNLSLAILGYLIGSFNIAIILSKRYKKDDVRNHNSGNAGATNSLRTYGVKFALIVFIFDALKSLIPILITVSIFNHVIPSFVNKYYLFSHIIGLGVIIGHIFPLYHNFKGGKGVASSVGFLMSLNPLIFLIAAIIFFSVFFIWKYVSLASILTAFLMMPFIFIPWMILNFSGKWINVLGFIGGEITKFWYLQGIIYSIIALIVIVSHHSNIKRLINHTEKKMLSKKQQKLKEQNNNK